MVVDIALVLARALCAVFYVCLSSCYLSAATEKAVQSFLRFWRPLALAAFPRTELGRLGSIQVRFNYSSSMAYQYKIKTLQTFPMVFKDLPIGERRCLWNCLTFWKGIGYYHFEQGWVLFIGKCAKYYLSFALAVSFAFLRPDILGTKNECPTARNSLCWGFWSKQFPLPGEHAAVL